MSSEVAEFEREVGGPPEDWRDVVLSDVAEVNPETLRASTSPDFAFGYIDISQIDGPGQCAGWTEQSFGEAPSRARRKVQAGDILVSTVRPYLRSFAQVPEADFPLIASTGFAVVRAGAEADQQFLYQHILHSSFIEHLTPRMTGSNYPAVSASDVEAYPIALPPLSEQRRIAEVLRSVDEAIASAKHAVEQSRMVQSQLVTALCFGQGFKIVSLGDVLADIRYGTSVKCDAGEADGYPVLRIPNVVNGRVELDDLKYASASDADVRRFCLSAGDIVLVRTNGNPAYIGRNALISEEARTLLFASYLIRLRCDADVAWSPYVHATLNSQPVREKLFKAATTSAGNYNINTASLKALSIPLPNPQAQREIGDMIQIANDAANACESDLTFKQQIKASLMSDLLSCRVRVPA